MAALPVALYELAEQAAFRVYVTDALYAMGDNKRLTQRYVDLLKPRKIERRTATEIADDVIKRCGLTEKGSVAE